MEKEHILIIEDEENIARFMELELTYENFMVTISNDGRQGLENIKNIDFDLIILDIMLPKINGLELCKKIREFSEIPIIMVTAKSDVSDIVTGLELGADDYLTKPFNMEELVARIKRLLKRKKNKHKKIILGNLILNLDTREVTRDKNLINLSKTEFELLKYLMINANLVLSREQILNNVWGYNNFSGENVVDVYIKYLRDKIEFNNEEPTIITSRGVGYMLKFRNSISGQNEI